MQIAEVNNTRIHYRLDGPEDGAPVVFGNSLGTDFRLWEAMLPHLPAGLRILRYDKRGHGLSDAPPAPYAMGQLVSDVEALIEHVGMKEVLFVGLSVGGLIAQGLAAKRLDLVRAIVLSNTGAKIGTKEMWDGRIKAVEEQGTQALAEGTMERWFSKPFRESLDMVPWQHMFERQLDHGWNGVAHAISGSDFYTTTAALRLPCLGIAGNEDGSTPPDLVRETIELVPGARMELMRGAGHLPCVEKPEEYAGHLTKFMQEIGHI